LQQGDLDPVDASFRGSGRAYPGADEGRGIGPQFLARKRAQSATFGDSPALIAKPLLCRRQNQKCLHFIHPVIFS
jgi:hypothetical protein